MRIGFHLLIGIALVAAAGCEKGRTPQQRAADTAHQVTFVGCVEPGTDRGTFVVKGRSVLEHVVATTGSEPGGVPSTETMRGGDADRNESRGGTREDWGERISPKLVSTNGEDFHAELGHRVVVNGEFVPASMAQPLDELKVQHLERVSDHCAMQ